MVSPALCLSYLSFKHMFDKAGNNVKICLQCCLPKRESTCSILPPSPGNPRAVAPWQVGGAAGVGCSLRGSPKGPLLAPKVKHRLKTQLHNHGHLQFRSKPRSFLRRDPRKSTEASGGAEATGAKPDPCCRGSWGLGGAVAVCGHRGAPLGYYLLPLLPHLLLEKRFYD